MAEGFDLDDLVDGGPPPEVIDGELEGTQLEAVPRDDTFWFVWFSFQPKTTILGAEALDGQER